MKLDETTAHDEGLSEPRIRFDPAHKISAASEVAESESELPSVICENASVDSVEHMRVQAGQLARHLQERARDADEREAQLNARIAQLENDLRVSRLWIRERNEEFHEREAELTKRIADQESQIRGLSLSEAVLDESRQQYARQLQTQEEQLRVREMSLAEAQQRLLEETDALRQARQELNLERHKMESELVARRQKMDAELLAGRQHEMASQEMEKNLHDRIQRLDEQERSLDEQWRQLHSDREDFQGHMTEAEEQLHSERQKLIDQLRKFEEQQERQHKVWEGRQERLDEQQITLQRIRNDILRLHREALEMRLVAEQLWSQMTAHLPPSDLTHGLSKLRSQLADEYRLAQQELTNQKTCLEDLLGKLDEKRRELAAQRDELMGWFTRRQNDVSQQTALLAKREAQLEQDKRDCQEAQQRWQNERRELQRQIRKLTVQLRHDDLVAA